MTKYLTSGNPAKMIFLFALPLFIFMAIDMSKGCPNCGCGQFERKTPFTLRAPKTLFCAYALWVSILYG
jgi:hypothetical protein